MLSKLKLSSLTKQLKDQRVFMRTDFNVPLKNGQISNDFRITSSLPSLDHILQQNPRLTILASHLGRPDGQRKKEFTMEPVFKYLQNIYKDKIVFFTEPLSLETAQKISSFNNKIVLLENLRFQPEEEGKWVNDKGEKIKCSKEDIKKFRDALNSFCDVFVNDAFGTMHRGHSSIVGIEKKFKAAGKLVEQELKFFGNFLENRKPNTTIVLGGAKVEDKIPIIKNLIKMCDNILIGGGMAFSFLKFKNQTQIGKSLFE